MEIVTTSVATNQMALPCAVAGEATACHAMKPLVKVRSKYRCIGDVILGGSTLKHANYTPQGALVIKLLKEGLWGN